MHEKIAKALDIISKESNYEKGTYKGFLCIAKRMIDRYCFFGNINGYVVIPKGHKYYGKRYDSLDIDCHGGLTYSGGKSDIWKDEPDIKYDDWIIGFDTAHADDILPFQYMMHTFDNIMRSSQDRILDYDASYKDMNFVKNECKKIVDQIV